MFNSIDELSELIQTLDKNYQTFRVNLIHSGGDSEGIWAVAADPRSDRLARDDTSKGDFCYARLVNYPLGWDGATWGGLVKFVTNGEQRAFARLMDQTDEKVVQDRANLAPLFEAARAAEREKQNATQK